MKTRLFRLVVTLSIAFIVLSRVAPVNHSTCFPAGNGAWQVADGVPLPPPEPPPPPPPPRSSIMEATAATSV